MNHKKTKHKPIIIQSIRQMKNKEICDLELFFLVVQELIQDQIKNGKKGKKLSPEYKMSYKKAQGILWSLNSYFGLKGCFSFGTCDTCENFNNANYSRGIIGKCKGKEKNWCDSCNEHTKEG